MLTYDEAKLKKHIKDENDCKELQNDVTRYINGVKDGNQNSLPDNVMCLRFGKSSRDLRGAAKWEEKQL